MDNKKKEERKNLIVKTSSLLKSHKPMLSTKYVALPTTSLKQLNTDKAVYADTRPIPVAHGWAAEMRVITLTNSIITD